VAGENTERNITEVVSESAEEFSEMTHWPTNEAHQQIDNSE
jgi:hypothetical protein